MEEILKYLKIVTDNRQEKKVRHKMSDIIALVFLAMLANANEWAAIEISVRSMRISYADFRTPNGNPHMIRLSGNLRWYPPFMQKFQKLWNEMLSMTRGKGQNASFDRRQNARGTGSKPIGEPLVSAVDEMVSVL
jgi:hypothetical protein